MKLTEIILESSSYVFKGTCDRYRKTDAGASLAANSRIQAIATDNRMMGHDEPDKMELKEDPWADMLSRIREGKRRESEQSKGKARQHCSANR